jgi:hypothetical protein
MTTEIIDKLPEQIGDFLPTLIASNTARAFQSHD